MHAENHPRGRTVLNRLHYSLELSLPKLYGPYGLRNAWFCERYSLRDMACHGMQETSNDPSNSRDHFGICDSVANKTGYIKLPQLSRIYALYGHPVCDLKRVE